jgi:hypothetical protein
MTLKEAYVLTQGKFLTKPERLTNFYTLRPQFVFCPRNIVYSFVIIMRM